MLTLFKKFRNPKLFLIILCSFEIFIAIIWTLFLKFKLPTWIIMPLYFFFPRFLSRFVILRIKNVKLTAAIILTSYVHWFAWLYFFAVPSEFLQIADSERKIIFYFLIALWTPQGLYSFFFAYRNLIFYPWLISEYGRKRIMQISSTIYFFKKPICNLDVKQINEKRNPFFVITYFLFFIVWATFMMLSIAKMINPWSSGYFFIFLMISFTVPNLFCYWTLSRARLSMPKNIKDIEKDTNVS